MWVLQVLYSCYNCTNSTVVQLLIVTRASGDFSLQVRELLHQRRQLQDGGDHLRPSHPRHITPPSVWCQGMSTTANRSKNNECTVDLQWKYTFWKFFIERNDFKLLEMFQLELKLIFYVGVCCSIEQIIWNRISSLNREHPPLNGSARTFFGNLIMQIPFIATDFTMLGVSVIFFFN